MLLLDFASKHVQKIYAELRRELVGWIMLDFLAGSLVVGNVVFRRSIAQDRHALQASSKLWRFAIGIFFAVASVLSMFWYSLLAVLFIVAALSRVSGQAWLAERLWLAYGTLTFGAVLQSMIVIAPQCTVCFLHYWSYKDQDKVFISALRRQATILDCAAGGKMLELACALEVLPVESTLQWLKRTCTSTLRGVSLGLCALTMAYLPGIGPLVLQGLVMLKQRRAVGNVVTGVLVGLSLGSSLPSWLLHGESCRVVAAYCLQLALVAMSISRQLLYPFLARCGGRSRRSLRGRHQARILGFGVAAAAVLNVPVIGPLLWYDLVWAAAKVLSGVVVDDPDGEVFDLGSRPTLQRPGESRATQD